MGSDQPSADVSFDLFADEPVVVEDPLSRCPRCGASLAEGAQRFYGPCVDCRSELRAKFLGEARTVEVAEYEPKMNVTPNAVALKDD